MEEGARPVNIGEDGQRKRRAGGLMGYGHLRAAMPLADALGVPVARIDDPPLVTFVVGGAGAQTEIVGRALPSLASAIGGGRLRLSLVAGIRPEVDAKFRRIVRRAGLTARLGDGIDILLEPDLHAYYRAFDRLMWKTDVLWTKPSELVFYGGLGIPEVLAPPVGVQEESNRRWILERGAALDQRDPRHAGSRLGEWLDESVLAAAAEAAFRNLPRDGTRRILDTGSRFRST